MGNLMSKHRGRNPDSPIYKAGFVVGGKSFKSSSPSTNQESSVSSQASDDPVPQSITLMAQKSEHLAVDDSDSGKDHPCTICGASTQIDCGHLVAAYDVCCGELIWGELHEPFDTLIQKVRDEFFHAVKHKEFRFQVSEEVMQVAAQLSEDACREDIEEALAEDRLLFKQLIIDRLKMMPGVTLDMWEFDGLGPGTATIFMDFWAENPKAVISNLIESFSVGQVSEEPLDPNETYTPDHPRYAEALKQNPMLDAQNGMEAWLRAEAEKYTAAKPENE